MERKALFFSCSSLCLLASVLPLCVASESHDAAALLALKSSVDSSDALPWRSGSAAGNVCGWAGVRECSANGRVTKLVLEFLNLTGELPAATLAPLDELRVLSFKSNALSGEIPDVSALTNLKSLFLSNNRFSGRIPPSLSTLRRLKVIALSGNIISGEIPASLTTIPRLYALLLQDNRLTGRIPAFAQMGLKYFNVSGNRLSGDIPRSRVLRQFNASSFTGNPNLCGEELGKPCLGSPGVHIPPSASPTVSILVPSPPFPPPSPDRRRTKRIAGIVAGSVGAFLFFAVLLGLGSSFFLFSRRRRMAVTHAASRAAAEPLSNPAAGEVVGEGGGGGGGGGGAVFSWDREGLGKLVFCGDSLEMYTLEELLKASAETLGRGTMGRTYKAVMASGFIVTVKRLRESGYPEAKEFGRRAEALGALRHPNLVPLRAYFQAREERLLVYDYFPNGSLFSLIHGSRPNGGGKPLHWTSCLKIAEDVAAGLLHLHQTPAVAVHGNLKSSNVLLGSDFESCLTDYTLVPFFRPPGSSDDTDDEDASLFYRAPECRHPRRQPPTQQSDVYSFGVLLLELLTGKAPDRDLVREHGEDIPRWVRSVREQERESDEDPASPPGNEALEERLAALVRIAAACVAPAPERRPSAAGVLRMVRDARAEVVASSNSSDHSPGRWSDAVRSLPRDSGSDHINFVERD